VEELKVGRTKNMCRILYCGTRSRKERKRKLRMHTAKIQLIAH